MGVGLPATAVELTKSAIALGIVISDSEKFPIFDRR
ncbi:MAG: hypothetical protein ACI8Y4_002987 [Candidatus Poriferisodalaceae bacterium]|jgi:hypothetical protein